MQLNNPKVSVILPTFNRADLLPETIQSVLKQDFMDLELIVIDDGSTDHTTNVVGAIQKQDSRLKYFKLPENRGVCFARDVGWRRATGMYLAWADSDDPWLPGKLSLQVKTLEDHPEIDILFGNYLNIDHIKNTRSTLFERTSSAMEMLSCKKLDDGLFLIEAGVEKALLLETFVSLPTTLFRNNITEKTGGFDIAFLSSSDLEFFWRAALFNSRFAYNNCLVMERNKLAKGITADNVASWNGVLNVLDRCELWCQRQHKNAFMQYIRVAQQRACRNLIVAYRDRHQLGTALQLFWRGLNYGFSPWSFIYMLVALVAPDALHFISNWYRRN